MKFNILSVKAGIFFRTAIGIPSKAIKRYKSQKNSLQLLGIGVEVHVSKLYYFKENSYVKDMRSMR